MAAIGSCREPGMIAMSLVLGIFGAVAGTLAALWVIVHYSQRRNSKSIYTGTRAARDVTLLVTGSFAGMIALSEIVL